MTAGTPEKTRLKAKAMQLGIQNFRTMTLDELRAAVEGASSKPASSNGATTRSGSGSKAAPARKTSSAKKKSSAKKTATKAASKKKTSARAATKKVAPRRSVSPRTGKGTAAAKTKSAPARKSTARKSAPKRGAAAQGTAKRRASGNQVVSRHYEGGKVGKGGYTNIDRGSIDWSIESHVGRTGKRKDVLDSLRKHDGDYDAVFVALRDNAPRWYPNALKAYPDSGTKVKAAERQLRWLIGRVAYDYSYKTGQHAGRAKTRAKSASKTASAKTKTSASRKSASKPTRAPQRAAKRSSKAKAAPKRGAAPVRSKGARRAHREATARKRGVR